MGGRAFSQCPQQTGYIDCSTAAVLVWVVGGCVRACVPARVWNKNFLSQYVIYSVVHAVWYIIVHRSTDSVGLESVHIIIQKKEIDATTHNRAVYLCLLCVLRSICIICQLKNWSNEEQEEETTMCATISRIVLEVNILMISYTAAAVEKYNRRSSHEPGLRRCGP